MKRFFVYIAALILFCCLIFVFVQFKENSSREGWRLESIDDWRVMSLKQEGITFSDGQSALFLKKLRYDSFPVSAKLSFITSPANENLKELICKISYKDIVIEDTIKNLDISSKNSAVTLSGKFEYDLSNLKDLSTEDEIFDFIKAFSSDSHIHYSIKPIYDPESQEPVDWIDLR